MEHLRESTIERHHELNTAFGNLCPEESKAAPDAAGVAAIAYLWSFRLQV